MYSPPYGSHFRAATPASAPYACTIYGENIQRISVL
jgi:hypothetical protein